jgi:hypothetical protein
MQHSHGGSCYCRYYGYGSSREPVVIMSLVSTGHYSPLQVAPLNEVYLCDICHVDLLLPRTEMYCCKACCPNASQHRVLMVVFLLLLLRLLVTVLVPQVILVPPTMMYKCYICNLYLTPGVCKCSSAMHVPDGGWLACPCQTSSAMINTVDWNGRSSRRSSQF